MATDGAHAVNTTKMDNYIEMLVEGTATYQGVMRRNNKISKKANIPFKHQKKTVEKWTRHKARGSEFILLNHDMGTGKSALLMQMYAKMSTEEERKIKMIVSVPIATLEQWKNAVHGWTTIKQTRVLVTNDPKKISAGSIADKSIVVLSHSCLTSIFKKCYKLYPRHHTVGTSNRWVSAWDLKTVGAEGTHSVELLAPFDVGWDIMGVDEAHVNVNVKSKICNAHAKLAQCSKYRVMLTGTACINRPTDLAGIAKAGNAVSRDVSIDFQSVKSWTVAKASRGTVNRHNVTAFQKEFVSRYKIDNGIGQMPLLVGEDFVFKVYLSEDDAATYQDILEKANNLRWHMARNDDGRNVVVLMQAVTKLSQFLVSPLLARLGAKTFESCHDNFVESIKEPSDTIIALVTQIRKKMAAGHKTVLVASASVVEMKIAKFYMEQDATSDYGQVYLYSGKDNPKQRLLTKEAFLASQKAVMFLSISAGGSGLHLVPGCACLIFFGMMSYSPASMQQCVGRIYRHGQTETVQIVNVIAYGSPEYAIGSLHKDKKNLINFVQDSVVDPQYLQANSVWKRTLKIVGNCFDFYRCDEDDGSPIHFEYNDITQEVVLAVMMSHNKRLGAASILSTLSVDLLQLVFGTKKRIVYYSLPSMPEGTQMVHYN